MRRRPSILIKATTALTSVVLLASCAGCEAKVYGSPGDNSEAPRLTMVAPAPPPTPPPRRPPANPPRRWTAWICV